MTKLTELSLYFPQLPQALENIRILHISDLHTRGFRSKEQKIRQVIRQGFDMLVCTGDSCYQLCLGEPFRESGHRQTPAPIGVSRYGLVGPVHTDTALAVFRRLLADITFPLGAFAVQGNHDSNEFMAGLPELGVTVLNNQTRQIGLGDCQFNIMGLRGYGRSAIDIPQALLQMDPLLFTIALSHYPEATESLAAAGVDLVLLGHTHGGQLRLPGGRPLTTHTYTGIKYAVGLERIINSYSYTHRGTGYTMFPMRIFCPAEIVRFTLHQGDFANTTISSSEIS